MIATIIILLMALIWLIYETDFMRVRLESTQCQTASNENTEATPDMPRVYTPPDIPEGTIPFKPSDFTPLDMPETTGNINIVCVRE